MELVSIITSFVQAEPFLSIGIAFAIVFIISGLASAPSRDDF